MEQKIVTVNWNKNQVLSQLNTKPAFEKCYLTGLYGRKLIHASHSTYKDSEYSSFQHCIVVRPKLESSSLNNNSIQLENADIADIAIIPAQTNYWSRIESTASEAIILSIEPSLLNRTAYETTKASYVELKPAFEQTDLLIQSIALNIKVDLDSRKSDRFYLESLFQALLMHLLKNYCTQEHFPKPTVNGLPPYRLKQAIDYIDRHLDENIKIKDIARFLGISQYYFCRLFRESTGIAPYRYVIQQRILKAKTSIAENRLSLSDIAAECGFSSQSQMTHHFRKLVGTTPKVYRDRLEQ